MALAKNMKHLLITAFLVCFLGTSCSKKANGNWSLKDNDSKVYNVTFSCSDSPFSSEQKDELKKLLTMQIEGKVTALTFYKEDSSGGQISVGGWLIVREDSKVKLQLDGRDMLTSSEDDKDIVNTAVQYIERHMIDSHNLWTQKTS